MTPVQTLRTARQAAPLLARGACSYDGASGVLQFSWRSVAASAVGAGVGQAVGGALGLDKAAGMDPGELFGKRLLTSFAAGAATAVARGGRIAVQQVMADAFSNVVGQSLVEASAPATQGFGPSSSVDHVNGADLQSDQAYTQRLRNEVYGFASEMGSPGLRLGGGAGLTYAGARAGDGAGGERYAGMDFASTGKVSGIAEPQALDPRRRGELESYWRGQYLYAVDEPSTRRQEALMTAKINSLNERINGLYGNDSGLRAALIAERDIHQNAKGLLEVTTPRERAETLAIGKVLDATRGLDRSQAADLVNRWLDQSLDSANPTHQAAHAALIGDPRITKGLHGFDPTLGYDAGAGPLGVLNQPRLSVPAQAETSNIGRFGFGVSRGGTGGSGPGREPVVLDLFGGRTSQNAGAINVDIVAQQGVRASATQLPFGDNVAKRVIASNPYIPGGSGMMDFLPEAARVLQPGGQIVINSTARNPFGVVPDADTLSSLGLRVVQNNGPLLSEFKNNVFRFTDGRVIPNTSVRSTVLQKVGHEGN